MGGYKTCSFTSLGICASIGGGLFRSQDYIFMMGSYSRQVLKYLRHGCEDDVNWAGMVDVRIVLRLFGGGVNDLQEMVDQDLKGRFYLCKTSGEWCIAATQGHSYGADRLKWMLRPLDVELHPIVFHGTYVSNLEGISRDGLRPMGRDCVHMSTGLPGRVLSGCRADCTVLICVDAERAVRDGIEFQVSHNDVVLVRGNIPVKYLMDVCMWRK